MNDKTNEFAAKVVEEIVGYPITEQNAIFAEIRDRLIKYRKNVTEEMDGEIKKRSEERGFAWESMEDVLMSAYSPEVKGSAR